MCMALSCVGYVCSLPAHTHAGLGMACFRCGMQGELEHLQHVRNGAGTPRDYTNVAQVCVKQGHQTPRATVVFEGVQSCSFLCESCA